MDIGIDTAAREKIAEAVRDVLAETYAVYGKTHVYHWNVTGPRFRSLHLMFEEQYTELWNALDDIAERLRSLDYYAPVNLSELASRASVKPDNDVPDAESMVRNLARDQETLSKAAKAAVRAAEEGGDPATADLMTQRSQIAEKTAWMLRASL